MEELMKFVSDHVGIQKPMRVVSNVEKGVLSQNYILTDGVQKYFLKRYRFANIASVAYVHKAKHFFAQGGIPVILPIEGKSGTYFAFDGGNYALFPFVDAQQIDRKDMAREPLVSMSALLAQIHLVGADLPFGAGGEVESWNAQEFVLEAEQIRDIIVHKASRNEFDEIALRGLELKLQVVNKGMPKYEEFGLDILHQIHGDFQDANVFFDDQQHVSHVFDFEKTTVKPRIYEVLRSMDYLCMDGAPSEDDLQKAEAFISTYHRHYPLSVFEVRHGFEMYYFKKLQGLWIEKEHYLKQNFRPDVFLQRHVESLEYMTMHRDVLAKRFCEV